MKKIICPTDFSPTATNAIEYASKLAQTLNAELEIVHVQLLSTIHPVLSGISIKEETLSKLKVLEETCEGVNRTFNISCDYSIATSNKPLEKVIRNKSDERNIIVIGTNGVDDLYQYFFGTNTYQVIRKSKCPVLVVPDNVTYGTIKKVVFGLNYNKHNKESLLQLKNILGVYNPEIVLLHISKQKSIVSGDVFRALQEDLHSPDERNNIVFDRVYEENPIDFPHRLDQYMNDSKADILAITYYDRGTLKNIFHGTIAKSLSKTARYPLLILHV